MAGRYWPDVCTDNAEVGGSIPPSPTVNVQVRHPAKRVGESAGRSFATTAPPWLVANPFLRPVWRAVVRSVDLSPPDMRDDSSDLPELWDVDRLVAYLGTSKHLVYRLTHEHRIRFLRVG